MRRDPPTRTVPRPAVPSSRYRLLGALLGVLALGACGASESADDAGEDVVVAVTMTDGNRFSPATVTVPRGGTVVWRNASSVVHTVTGSGMSSGNIQPGGTYRHTFDDAGRKPYYCVPHRQAGMTGAVVVR